jgi:DNA-binding SARP family transcriptional activator
MVIMRGARSNRRASSPYRWMVSLLGVFGLVAGVPAVLVMVHLTLPVALLAHLVTNPTRITHDLRGSFNPSILVNSIRLAAWMAWLWLATCVCLEVAAAIRGRPAWRLPASRHLQSFVATLMGASLALVPLSKGVPLRLEVLSTGVVHAIHSEPAATLENHSSWPWRGPSGLTDFRSDTVSESDISISQPITVSTYEVRRGDTLWSIAERELGSPLRWPEIAALNYGRVQADGRELTDAHWIYPGWQLLLPSAARDADFSAPAPPDPPPELHSPSDTEPFVRSVPTPLGLVDGRRPTIHSEKDQATNTRNRYEEARLEHRRSASPRETPPAIPLDLVGYSVLGAGVVILLDRMRRVQRRHRPTGLRIALPVEDLVALERRLRVEADPMAMDAIDLGLRALVVLSQRAGQSPPALTAIRLGEHRLEVDIDHVSYSGDPPSPFAIGPSSTSWVIDTDDEILGTLRNDSAITQIDAPYPALVSVGRDQTGLVLVDLEQLGAVDVSGEGAQDFLQRIGIELATAQWSDQLELLLVGFDQGIAFERVSHFSTIADVMPRVQRRIRERRALLASIGQASNWEIRWSEGGDSWDLCLVVCSPQASDQDPSGAEELALLVANGGAGVAVVFGSKTKSARCHLQVDESLVDVCIGETRIRKAAASPLTSDLVDSVASLVNIAADLKGVSSGDPPYREIADRVPPSPAPVANVVSLATPEVEVRILGPIDISGAARPFTRAWAVELVVYLAMHRNGASSDQWATALWPDRIMAPASLHSTASAARRSLGISNTGEDHLPRAHGRLSLGPSVQTDWDRFVASSESENPESWRSALDLIRGRPFEGLRSSDWVLLEGIGPNVEAIVVDLAQRYAENALSSGEPGEAEWAARQGLQVSAYDERLYRVLLRAANSAGNPAGVESIMAELVRLVADDVEPFDAVHPETLELYRSLSRRPFPFARR